MRSKGTAPHTRWSLVLTVPLGGDLFDIRYGDSGLSLSGAEDAKSVAMEYSNVPMQVLYNLGKLPGCLGSSIDCYALLDPPMLPICTHVVHT